MRRYGFINGSVHHVVFRGTRQQDIFLGQTDFWHANRLLYYNNDANRPRNWEREIHNANVGVLERPSNWLEREPLVAILAYCLHANHVHLLLEQLQDNGISTFMRRVPKCITHYYNTKYGGSGSVFQGPYKSRHITDNSDLMNVALYIMVKNVFERYPHGGLTGAMENVGSAYAWALADDFSSFPDYANNRTSPIVMKSLLATPFPTVKRFQKEVYQYIQWRAERESALPEAHYTDFD